MSLFLSLVALVLGPVLYSLFDRHGTIRSSLDGFLFATIAGLVVVYILPDAFDTAGVAAIGFLLLGVGFAFIIERQPRVLGTDRYSWIVAMGALALIVHAAMDGIALLPGEHAHTAHSHSHAVDQHSDGGWLGGLPGNHLALGVILHRIPVSMAVWWTLRPQLGSLVAAAALGLIAIGTIGAYMLGEPAVALMQSGSIACFQAFVAGTLLHVIVCSTVHSGPQYPDAPHRRSVIGERLGVIAGLILLFMVPHAH